VSRERQRSRRGFTLMELIVVITIIGILASIVVLNYPSMVEKFRQKRVRADFKAVLDAGKIYKMEHGRAPTSVDELVNPPSDSGQGQEEGLLSENPIDPWGTPYILSIEENKLVVISAGPDRQEGTMDDIRSDESAAKDAGVR
jgi:general secretion pathway protein G